MPEKFTHRSTLPFPPQLVFDWHKRAGALERLTPPWENVSVTHKTGTIRDGDRVELTSRMLGIPMTWIVEHRDYVEGRQFRDQQLKGPFAYWRHTHKFEPAGENACEMIDDIEYELPLGGLGAAFGEGFTRGRLTRMFEHRHRVLARDLAEQPTYAGPRPMSVAVTGANGLIGSSLVPLLTSMGHGVKRIVRREGVGLDEVGWQPKNGVIEAHKMEGVDAVVHLAGENILGRWTPEKRQRIRDSRVAGTHGLATALAKLPTKPGVLVCASAIGFYGNRPGETITEESSRGTGFLPDVCEEWEAAAQPAVDAGIRVVHLRIGVVLTPRGGALKLMLPVFNLCLGGIVGSGNNWMSWITAEDLTLLAARAIVDDRLRGPVNATAPNPVTQREFVRALAGVLGRPAVFPVPEFVIRRAAGDLADEALLADNRVLPTRVPSDHRWRHPILEQALREILGKPAASAPDAA